MIAFTRETTASRVTFGPGRLLAINAEADRLGAERALMISTGSAAAAAARAAAELGRLVAAWARSRAR